MWIDLNCDLGEGGQHDAAVMPWISSANIACGGHAGDESTMRATLALAAQHGVAVGAHPGYCDRASFGRRELTLAPKEVEALVAEQVGALAAMAAQMGQSLIHVKPHGALYNQAARDSLLMRAVVRGVRCVDESLLLVALAGSAGARTAQEMGLRLAEEVFADRRYLPNGQLLPREDPRSMLEDAAKASHRIVICLNTGRMEDADGGYFACRADTICLHGDQAGVVAFARELRESLLAAGVNVAPFGEEDKRS